MEAFSIELSAKFGYFQWEKTKGDKRVSNLFISKTDVLGILGAVIGLDGYGQEMFRHTFDAPKQDTFYRALGGLGVAIIPKSTPTLFEDQLIHRQMEHVNKKGSLMVTMFGLLSPSYKVIVKRNTVDKEVFEKLVTYLQNGWSEFVPYCGKNQFPLEIGSFEEEVLSSADVSEPTVVHSLYKQSILTAEPLVTEFEIIEEDGFHYVESLKLFEEEGSSHIVNEPMIWSSFEAEVNDDVYLTNQNECITFL